MRIEELAIGSHVLFNGERVEVVAIDTLFDEDAPIVVTVHEVIASGEYDIPCEPMELDPIPITEELLTELGFEEYPHTPFGFDVAYDYIDKDGHTLIEVANRKGNTEWRVQGVGWTRVHYLHELEAFVYLTTKQRLI